MPIDTAIPGDPESVIAVANWLGYTLAPPVLAGADTLGAVRRDASSDWDGAAGLAFAERMGSGRREADELNVGIVAMAREIEAFGQAIRIAQQRMAAIRVAAAAGGLELEGMVILEPGPAPPDPGALFNPVLGYQRMAVNPAVTAHQRATVAYATAAGDAAFAREQLQAAKDGVERSYRGLEGPEWGLAATDIAGGFRAGAMQFNAGALRLSAQRLQDDAAVALSRALANDPTVVGSERYYRDIDAANRLSSQSDDLIRQADDLDGRARSLNAKIGGAVALAGVGYEIYRGKDPAQAVVVGGGSFLASVGAASLTGMAVGSVVPIPGVGTAVGGVVGVGVGIFMSGALDSVFENGPNVEAAAQAGWAAVTDTVGAIGESFVGAAKGLGGLL